VGDSKRLRKQVESLTRHVREHYEKIAAELGKDDPNFQVIEHWKKEIQAWEQQIERKRARLSGRRR